MKKLLLVVLLVLTALLTGCDTTGTSKAEKAYQNISPSIVQLGVDNDGFYYLVDKNTGVAYLGYDGFRRSAITVMLNKDGTPVTADQLGIKY